MSPLGYPQVYLDLYAVHQVFMRLGFEPEEIFVAVRDVININKTNVLCAVLRSQGKEFIFTLDSLGDDMIEKEVLAKWTTFVEKITISSFEVKQQVFEKSRVVLQQVLLVEALAKKGFKFPGVPKAGAT
jgi:hypothetical protein